MFFTINQSNKPKLFYSSEIIPVADTVTPVEVKVFSPGEPIPTNHIPLGDTVEKWRGINQTPVVVEEIETANRNWQTGI